MFNDRAKLDHSLDFASVPKALGRVRGVLFIPKKKTTTTRSTRVKSQFALKVYFIEGKTLDVAWDLCDFHKLLLCCVYLIYRNLVNCQLQEQVNNCRKSLKL